MASKSTTTTTAADAPASTDGEASAAVDPADATAPAEDVTAPGGEPSGSGDTPAAFADAAPVNLTAGALVRDTVYGRIGVVTGYDEDYPAVSWLGTPCPYTPSEPLEVLGLLG